MSPGRRNVKSRLSQGRIYHPRFALLPSMFPPTQPVDAPDRRPGKPAPDPDEPPSDEAGASGHTALSSLSPSLLQDLQRFAPAGPTRELLEVLAAGVRHTQPLAIDLAWGQSALTLSLFPRARTVHSPLPMSDFLASDLASLQVRQVRPALLRPPGDAAASASIGDVARYAPRSPLLWAIALRGARSALLPELAGQAAFRVAPGVRLSGLDMPGAMASCITRLRRQTSNLADIAGWHDIGPERATRLLNALYLQSGLIVSRSHPAATNAGWTGYD